MRSPDPHDQVSLNAIADLPGHVRQLIADGETASVEFKSSFKFDVQTRAANKALPAVVAKTMCGFLNATGGTLLVGVADEGTLLGIQQDVGLTSSGNLDALERMVRATLANYLGVAISPCISFDCVALDDVPILCLRCSPHPKPVFFRDGDKQVFYVRDGNLTNQLGIGAAHEYITTHWPAPTPMTEEALRAIVADAVRSERTASVETPPSLARMTDTSPWLSVGSRRVLQLFIEPLARSHGWKRLYLISPWISSFGDNASITFVQMLKRMTDDRTTAYVVTRPPQDDWHKEAVDLLAATGRANIAFLPDLHVKLYAAQTATGSFAMMGSANFTQAALSQNVEIGVRVTGYAAGKRIVTKLEHEAANIYRAPGRQLVARSRF
jgi:hypothetical protein